MVRVTKCRVVVASKTAMMQRPVIRLYSNRSACFVKLKKFDKVGLAGSGESWVKGLQDVWYSKHYTREGDRYGFNSRAVCFLPTSIALLLSWIIVQSYCVQTEWRPSESRICLDVVEPAIHSFAILSLEAWCFGGQPLGPHGRHWQMQRNVPHWSQNGPRLVGTTHVGCSSSDQLFVIR